MMRFGGRCWGLGGGRLSGRLGERWRRGGWVLLPLLCLLLAPTAAAGALLLDQRLDNEPLWPAMELLEEGLALEEVMAGPAARRFRAVDAGEESLSGLQGAYWVRISVHNPHDRPVTWYLHHQNARVAGMEPVASAAGVVQAGAVQRLRHRSPAFAVTTPPQSSQQIYVLRSAPERLVFRAAEWRAWTPGEFHAYQQRDAAFKGALYGGMLALVLYNLFLFVSLRIHAYGYYVLFASLFGLAWLSWEGLLPQAWLAGMPRLLEPTVFALLGAVAATQFFRLVLGSRSRAPGLDRGLRALQLLFAVGVVISLAFPSGATLGAALTMGLVVLPAAAAICWYRGFWPARFLVIGSMVFAVGGVWLVLLVLRGVAVTDGPLQLMQTLHLTELLLLSFALADRMKVVEQEKAAAQKLHQDALRRGKVELEELVGRRTRELERARSEAMALARSDPLTGAANRRAFFEAGSVELERAERYRRPLSVIMIDLDHFKSINDDFGHAAGDAVLRACVACMAAAIRSCDRLARLGGEEFAVLLPDTDLAAAEQLARRLCHALASLSVPVGDERLRLTASLGVTSAGPSDRSLDNLLNRADVALYAAKSKGRNRVVARPAATTASSCG